MQPSGAWSFDEGSPMINDLWPQHFAWVDHPFRSSPAWIHVVGGCRRCSPKIVAAASLHSFICFICMASAEYMRASPNPAEPINNTGIVNWTIPLGAPSSTSFQLLISSTDDPSNFAVSKGYFTVQGQIKWYEWRATRWGSCTKVCGGGINVRNLTCVNGATGVSDNPSLCNQATQPTFYSQCNTHPCPQQCPSLEIQNACYARNILCTSASQLTCIKNQTLSAVTTEYCGVQTPSGPLRSTNAVNGTEDCCLQRG